MRGVEEPTNRPDPLFYQVSTYLGETSGIVTATHPRHEAGVFVKALAGKDVVLAARAGRLRFSPHFYNTEEEIDRALEALEEVG